MIDAQELPVDNVTIIRTAEEASQATGPVAVMVDDKQQFNAALNAFDADQVRFVTAPESVTGPGYMNAAYWPSDQRADVYILPSDSEIDDATVAQIVNLDAPVFTQLPNGTLYQVYRPRDVASVAIDDSVPPEVEKAQKYAAEPAENPNDWQPYTGAKGGRGWINPITGEIRYQTNKPGARGPKKKPTPKPPKRPQVEKAGINKFEEQLKKKYENLDLLHLSEDASAIKLDHIRMKAGQRGKGTGSDVIRDLQQYAAEQGKPIILESQPEPRKKKALEDFYKGHGFKNPGRNRDFSLSRHTHIWHPPKQAEEQPQEQPQEAPKQESPANPHMENFKRWFGDSKVVDQHGQPLVVFHGGKRPDRIGDHFREDRSTSGPMAFFTDDSEIASNYATGKSDTSIEVESLADYFTVNGQPLAGGKAWASLTPQQRNHLRKTLPKVGFEDYDTDGKVDTSGEFALVDENHFDFTAKRETRGDYLRAAFEIWVNSASLAPREEEGKLVDIFKAAGIDSEFNDPYAEYPSVYPVHLSIQNPLDTGNIPDEVIEALEDEAGLEHTQPEYGGGYGADIWDKRTRDPVEWVELLKEDQAQGKNSFVWSSIPDWVTEVLRSQGYDGIQDTGGKMGGKGHTVWVPFRSNQVKSAIANKGAYDPENPSINHAKVRPSFEERRNIRPGRTYKYNWQPYTGARGGKGWINPTTGEIRYQTNSPGATRKPAAPQPSPQPATPQQPAPQQPQQPDILEANAGKTRGFRRGNASEAQPPEPQGVQPTEEQAEWIEDNDLFEQMREHLTPEEIALLAKHAEDSPGSGNLAGFSIDDYVMDYGEPLTPIVMKQASELGLDYFGEELRPGAEIPGSGGDQHYPKEAPDWDEWIRNHGAETDWLQGSTGFIMSDGTAVDLGGGQYRANDHRMVVPSEETGERWGLPKQVHGRYDMLAAMLKSAEAIRINVSPDARTLNLDIPHGYLTSGQARIIAQHMQEYDVESITIDTPDGDTEIDMPYSFAQVQQAIEMIGEDYDDEEDDEDDG